MEGKREREENVWWYDDDIQEGNVVVKVDGFVGVDDCEVFCEPHFEFRVYWLNDWFDGLLVCCWVPPVDDHVDVIFVDGFV